MTELQAAEIIQLLSDCRWLLLTIAYTLGMCFGGQVWRTIISAKNQSRFW